MYEKFGQFIDGKWMKASGGETYEVINPANEEILGHASKASPEDVEKALKSAQQGLEVWKKNYTLAKIIYFKTYSGQDEGKTKSSRKMDDFRNGKTFK